MVRLHAFLVFLRGSTLTGEREGGDNYTIQQSLIGNCVYIFNTFTFPRLKIFSMRYQNEYHSATLSINYDIDLYI
jgi:hypothetical protein